MKHKIVNNMFFSAGYSFSFLRMYYDHVLILFDNAFIKAQKTRERMKAEYESKGREYDTEHFRKFHKVFDEVYPGYFHNSFLTSACSQFEHEVKKLCAIIQEEHKTFVAWDEMEGPTPVKIKSYLNLAGVELKDDPPRIELPPPDFKPTAVYDENRIVISTIWKELRYYYRVRNCIVHDNGLLDKARGSSTLKKYAAEKGILVERAGEPEIQLNQEFNGAVCDTMRKFFDKLGGAYYSAPLPEE